MIPSPPPFWMRHTASVPKGFIRYRVLQLLTQQPMSGSEIMESIEKETEGQWKPSPGSIYPLLTWLKENNHIIEVESENPHIKRYALTESGKNLAKCQEPFTSKFQGGLGLFPPPMFMGPQVNGKWRTQFQKVFRKFFQGLFDLRTSIGPDPSPEILQQTLELVQSMLKQIKDFTQTINPEGAKQEE